MKVVVTASLAAALAGFSSAAEIKVATVDLQRLTTEYYRAEEVARQLETRRGAFLKELSELRLDGQKLAKETQELQEHSNDPALSAVGRDEIKKRFELKLSDLRAFELKYENTKAQREAEFQSHALQANKRILDEVLSTTRSISDKEGFNLVLNANKTNPAASDVLFTKNVDDITERILTSLNATKPEPTLPGPKQEPTKP